MTEHEALAVAVDDLYKAANQFAGLGYETNARRFTEKAERAKAALDAPRSQPHSATAPGLMTFTTLRSKD